MNSAQITSASTSAFTSSLFMGEIFHCRTMPAVHRFRYPVFGCLVNLDELPALDGQIGGFGYNRLNLLSIHDRDYFPGRSGSLKQKLLDYLCRDCENPRVRLLSAGIDRVELLTTPRQFLPVFNPVNFYQCFDARGLLVCVVAEVRNTFGETHIYTLTEQHGGGSPLAAHFRQKKEFHVSPFNDMNGEYRFYLSRTGSSIDFRVNIVREGKAAFVARLFGSTAPFTSANIARIVLSHPVTAHLALPRIMREAGVLYFRKGLRVYSKPIASSSETIRRRSETALQHFCRRLVDRYLSGLRSGTLVLALPDGRQYCYGERHAAPRATIEVKNYKFFRRSVFFGDIGFGDSYVEGDWDAADLTSVLRVLARNVPHHGSRRMPWSHFGRAVHAVCQAARINSRRGSAANVSAHYDLSNEFFSRFLDPSMTYSSAVFQAEHESLEQAQVNKLRRLIAKARIEASDHVLEIGSGWGSFAVQAVRDTGCRVTTVTLSKEQKKFVEERVAQLGMADRIEVALCDYREVEGRYDKIVSIEMLEAVGHRFYGRFFSACERLLKPEGIVCLQVITMPDQRYDSYRRGCDWIQRRVFPGGLCPSLSVLAAAMKGHSRLVIEEIENIGLHYARTLSEWKRNFRANRAALLNMGYDERFQRLWNYYLSYCEAGFAEQIIGTHQLVLTRPGNRGLAACPGYQP